MFGKKPQKKYAKGKSKAQAPQPDIDLTEPPLIDLRPSSAASANSQPEGSLLVATKTEVETKQATPAASVASSNEKDATPMAWFIYSGAVLLLAGITLILVSLYLR